jgi:hypothetical protein
MNAVVTNTKNRIIRIGGYITDIDIGMIQHILNIAFEVLVIDIPFGIENQSSALPVALSKKPVIILKLSKERE